MATVSAEHRADTRTAEEGRLRAAGAAGWQFIGIVGACAIVFALLMVLRPLLLPLILAAALATCFSPLVKVLAAHRVPRAAGAILCALGVLAVGGLAVALFIGGLASQTAAIGDVLNKAVAQAGTIAGELGIGQEQIASIRQGIAGALPVIMAGLLKGVAGGVLALAQVVLGAVVALYLLFFLLKDATPIQRLAVGMLPLPRTVGEDVAARSAVIVRRYFAGLTVIGLMNTGLVVLGGLILDVPLLGAIAIVTFLLSYVPYIGAFAAGAFAVLIALGTGGAETAAWMLVVVILANGTLQNVLAPFAFGAALRVDPLLILLATLLGGVIAGVVGVALAVPVMAIALDVIPRIREQRGTVTSLG